MDSIQEAYEAAKRVITERLTHPLVFGFCISWSILNFNFFLIAFSSEKPADKMALLKTTVFKDPGCPTTVWWPLILAIAYIIFAPIVARWIAEYQLWQEDKKRKVLEEREGKQFLTVKEGLALKARESELLDLNVQLQGTISRLQDDCHRIRLKCAENVLDREGPRLSPILTESGERVLACLKDHPQTLNVDDIRIVTKLHPNEIQAVLEELRLKGLLVDNIIPTAGDGRMFRLNDNGTARAHLIDNRQASIYIMAEAMSLE